jgi:3-deoxy-D-manno-octulosonate 8-phosphate phosphatase KdsC-like HAD superfamily phosphatase
MKAAPKVILLEAAGGIELAANQASKQVNQSSKQVTQVDGGQGSSKGDADDAQRRATRGGG